MSNRDHNQGQKDCPDSFKEPYGTLNTVVDLFNPFVSSEKYRENLQRDEDYVKGWNNTWNQTHR